MSKDGKKLTADLRSPEVKAWARWLFSDEGKNCMAGSASGQYLENRLHRAFFAGIKAAQALAEVSRGTK